MSYSHNSAFSTKLFGRFPEIDYLCTEEMLLPDISGNGVIKTTMKMKMKKKLPVIISTMLSLAAGMQAQGPHNSGTYYQQADGQQGAALKSALCGIIRNHTVRSYGDLWTDFQKTDRRPDGHVWDMYSGVTNYTFGADQNRGTNGKEGTNYNREHSLPNSWWGGNKKADMYTDLFHMYPTDSFVNGRRGNNPFGETNGESYTSEGDFSKLGKSITPGYSGTVFEPNDEYKGDFARTYFYMATCYEAEITTWTSDMLNKTKYPSFAQWAIDMLLRWAEQDPVSEKELQRNEAVNSIQHNRNPFIDYPGLERLIWGDRQALPFSYDGYEASLAIDDAATVPTATGAPTYNLGGQRIDTYQLKPGLYIRGGRKYIVR